jgi:hypothetical protein
MVAHLSDVQRAFDELISETRSREEISAWARSLRLEDDKGQLSFEPAEMSDRIWRSLIYLEGVDLKDSPTTYLHVPEDFLGFRSRMGV